MRTWITTLISIGLCSGLSSDPVTASYMKGPDRSRTGASSAMHLYFYATGGSSFTIEDKGYVLGGINAGAGQKWAWRYDPLSDTWMQLADVPGGAGRYWAVAFSDGGKGYIGSGRTTDNKFLNDLWMYDPATNKWTARAALPGPGRAGATVFTLGGTAYVAAGTTGKLKLKELWAYTPATNTWTRKKDLPITARAHAVGFTVSRTGYLCSGDGYTKDLWAYSSSFDSWSRKADLPGVGRMQAVGFGINGKGYVGTGAANEVTSLNDLYAFDPLTNTWARMADLCAPARRQAVSFVTSTKAYIAGGAHLTTQHVDLLEYDPVTNTCRPRHKLTTIEGL